MAAPDRATLICARGFLLTLALVWSLAAPPAGAVSGDDIPEPPPDAGADAYAAGMIAFGQGDWQGVIEHMGRVLEQRPWHDNAHNLIGFAYRRLGDYERALEFYDQALELNPHNRGALEYLGEAYLEMDRPEEAGATLERLEVECTRVGLGAPDGAGPPRCEEWQELNAAYDAYLAGRRSDQAAR